MSGKHTPGPWRVSHEESPLDYCMELTVKGGDGLQVCSFFADKKDFANADLIAAAPDLLEALEAVDEMMDSGDVSETGWAKEWYQAKAAIAKAKGVANGL